MYGQELCLRGRKWQDAVSSGQRTFLGSDADREIIAIIEFLRRALLPFQGVPSLAPTQGMSSEQRWRMMRPTGLKGGDRLPAVGVVTVQQIVTQSLTGGESQDMLDELGNGLPIEDLLGNVPVSGATGEADEPHTGVAVEELDRTGGMRIVILQAGENVHADARIGAGQGVR